MRLAEADEMTFSTRRQSERLIEWLFASMMIAWGMYLWLPMATFDAPQYALLKSIADEGVWGAFSASIGGIRLVALWVNGQVRQTPLIRALGAGLGVVWWMVLTYLFISAPGQHMPAGVVWYPIFVLFEGYSCLRTGADAFVSGALRRPARIVK
jgi:hypothetical protein